MIKSFPRVRTELLEIPDARYGVQYQFCGYSVPMLVVRFCGESIGFCRNELKANVVIADYELRRLN